MSTQPVLQKGFSLWSITGTKITGISPDVLQRDTLLAAGIYITGRLLKYKQPYIHTDQTAFLRTELFDMGYRIFLHYANGAVMEIKLGDNPQPVGPLTASSDLQSILFPDGHLKHPVTC